MTSPAAIDGAAKPTYSPLGRFCPDCHGPLFLAPCGACAPTPFPTFGLLGGMLMLAETLLAHYEINPDDHPNVVAELERVRADPGVPMSLDETLRQLEIAPAPPGDAPRLLQVTVQRAGPGAGRVWIRWPDGETCEHPSLADARGCPRPDESAEELVTGE